MLMVQVVMNCYIKDPDGFDRDLREIGADWVLLSHCEFFESGEKRKKTLQNLSFALDRLRGQGYPVALWTNSLGWGDGRGKAFHDVFDDCTPLTNFDGRSGSAVCTLDPAFRACMVRNLQDYIRAGADLILWDDDLVQSVRPGFLCTCGRHLDRFAEITGKTYTRDEVRRLFTGKPSPRRAAYLDMMGSSMTEFCRALRQGADEIDPSVRMGLCCSYTHYDIEGVEMEDLLRLLAGKGNRPFMRLSGAAYWPVLSKKFASYSLNDVADFLRMQIGWLRGKDWDVLDENDPYPRDHYRVPASYVELYDKIVIANGGTNRNKYVARFAVDGDRSYQQAHIRHMARDQALEGIFAGLSPVGFYVHTKMHALRETTLPEAYMGDGALMSLFSLPLSAMFLNQFSLPAQFEKNGPGVLTGHLAETIPADELRGGVLLDEEAAILLIGRGIDPCAKLTPDHTLVPAEGAEILYSENGEPILWTGSNPEGCRFAVFARNVSEIKVKNRPWPDRRTLQPKLAQAYAFLSGRPLPVLLKNCPGAYVLASKNEAGDRMAVLIGNIWPDPIEAPVLETDGNWTPVETVNAEAAADGNLVRLSRIESFGYAAVLLTLTDRQ